MLNKRRCSLCTERALQQGPHRQGPGARLLVLPKKTNNDDAHTRKPTNTDDDTHNFARMEVTRNGRHINLLSKEGQTGDVERKPVPRKGVRARATLTDPWVGRSRQRAPTHAVNPTGDGLEELTAVATGAEGAAGPASERERLRWL